MHNSADGSSGIKGESWDKNRPSAAWMAALRRRFNVEPRAAHILTRKLIRRGDGAYQPLPMAQLIEGLRSLIAARIETPFEISEERWLSGGASKLQITFVLGWDRPGRGRERTRMVLRIEPAESIVATSRSREFQLIKAMQGVVPVPEAFWCDEDAKFLPYPALVCEFSPGVSKPSVSPDGVTGVGVQFGPGLRKALGPRFIALLARIHQFDFHQAGLDAFSVPAAGTQSAEWQLNWWSRVWEEDGDEEIPLLYVASNWLRRHLPRLDSPSVIHGDYRAGNFLFDERKAEITAVLDWELGHIGDRHYDLAYTTSDIFASMAEDGKTPLTCGLMPRSQFFDEYETATGFRHSPVTLRWYQILGTYTQAIILLATSTRIARQGKTHQDVLLAWLSGLGPSVLERLRGQLEEA